MTLLSRLRQGPLRADHFSDVSASAASLKVRIFQLRERGITIETVDLPNGRRRPKAEYHLLGGKCPCCEQELV